MTPRPPETIQEKANAWDYLNAAFGEPIDWTDLDYIIVKEGKEDHPKEVRFG